MPAGAVRNTDNASTFKPYDPSLSYGDSSPTTPKPQVQKKGSCGGLGSILLAIVAVAVVTVLTAGVASIATGATFAHSLGAVLGGSLGSLAVPGTSATLGAAGAIGAGVAGAVGGSILTQGLGVATGLQDKFDWRGVALAGIGGAIGGGLGSTFKTGMAGSQFLGNAARGAIASALSQGIAVATGLQSKFDFAGVATAAIGSGAGNAIRFGAADRTLGAFGQRLVSNTAGGIATAAARSVLNGQDFGDNLIAALPDIIGNTIGDLVADRISRGPRLAYGNAGSDGYVTGGSGTTGSGDGTQARPVAVAGGGQVGAAPAAMPRLATSWSRPIGA